MQQFSPGIKDIPESKGERKHKFSISTDIRSYAMALILWREEIENSFYMIIDISDTTQLITFLKKRSKYDGIDYLLLSFRIADYGFLGVYDYRKIISQLILDYLSNVVKNPEEYSEERINEILRFFYFLEFILDGIQKIEK